MKNTIEFSGALLALPQDAGADNLPGTIYLANASSRFTDSTFSEPLTAFAQGWDDPEDLRGQLARIAPDVPVGRRFEFKKTDNSADFLSETDDVRAIDAPFKRIEFRGETVSDRTYNKGLTVRLDKDGEGAVPGAEQRAVRRLMKRLFRNELLRAITALNAAATMSSKTWNASSDPHGDLLALINASGDVIGIDPNRLLIGRSAWIKAALALRATDKKAGETANLTPEQLAAWLGIDDIISIKARRATSKTTKAALLGNKVIAFLAEPDLSTDDPSSIKRFVTPVDAEAGVRVHVQDYPKYIDVSVEHYSNIVATSTLGVLGHDIS